MGDTKGVDLLDINFTSTVFPTDDDMRLWDSLSADEQRAVIVRDLEAAEASGRSEPESVEDRLKRVRAKMAHDL